MQDPEPVPRLNAQNTAAGSGTVVAEERRRTGRRLSLAGERSRAPEWLLVEEGFTLAREHEIESLFAIGNGCIGNRGSLAEGSPLSAPATFAAGVFELQEKPGAVPGLFVLPDWTAVGALVEGHPLGMREGEILEHRRILDLRAGVLWREWRHRDPHGRISYIVALRLVSMADRQLLAQSVWFVPENYSGQVVLEGKIELAPENVSFAPADEWKTRRDANRPNVLPLAVRAPGRSTVVAFGAASRLFTAMSEAGQREIEYSDRHIVERFRLNVEIGAEYRLDRLISIHSSNRDKDPVNEALQHVHRVLPQGMGDVLRAHTAAWDARWRDADLLVEGDDSLQRALRFAIYHLVSCANPEDERVSIGARALTGEAYKGHVFWDTEIYMVPFYTLTHPETARALLMYRYHCLPAARDKARAAGYAGAMYPWESADTGEETTPEYVIAPGGEVIHVLNGPMEVHITADVAYAAWQYWQWTGDDDFMRRAGAEILLETARFWASRGKWEEDGRYHIRQVIGPDEYHEGVDDSAFTNLIAAWNLRRGVEMARLAERAWPEVWGDLQARLKLTPQELEKWTKIAGGMFLAFDPHTKVFEQFHGFFQKEHIDLLQYEPRNTAMDVILGHERIQKTDVVKQADVVMAMYLLWNEVDPAVRLANFRYYEPLTGHGSSLSPSIHALVAARLGEMRRAEKYLRQAAEIDLGNNMGNAAGGVHAAAIGGLWQAMVFGFAGLEISEKEIALDPHLLPRWQRLSFPIQWRGRKLHVEMEADRVSAGVEAGPGPVPVRMGENTVAIDPQQRFVTRRTPGGWEPWRSTT